MRRLHRFLVVLLCGPAVVGLGGEAAAAQVPVADQLEVILAIDASGSMQPAMDAAKAAAIEFVGTMPPDVRIGVETFGDDVNVLTPPTADRVLLVDLINAIAPAGDTALYDVVVTASQGFTPTVQHKVLVVLSDGKDDGSTATLEDAIAAVAAVHVEAISLTTAQTDIYSLLALGQVTSADDAAGMSAAFARVASLIVEVVAPSSTVAAPTTPAPTTPAPSSTVAAPATPAPTVPPTTLPQVPATTGYSRAPAPSVDRTSSDEASSLLGLGALGVFVGLFALGVLLFPRQRVSKARLGIDKPRTVSDMGKRTMSAVDEALERHGKRAGLATALSVADISMQPAEFIAMVAVVAVVAGMVGLLFGGALIGLGVATMVCLVVRLYVGHIKEKRQAAFADQLPEVLQLVTTSLRSGYGLTQAIESVAEEAEEPARGEFAHVLVEARLGRDLSEAMRALAQRMESKDLDWVVAAIDINRETGGNLSEILHTVSTTIRERQSMARHVRTLTAEGRMSARVLTALPLLMVLWQWRANPEHFALLTHGAGLVALFAAGILMVLGSLWVHKVVKSVVL
jgi:tight adherence protein B